MIFFHSVAHWTVRFNEIMRSSNEIVGGTQNNYIPFYQMYEHTMVILYYIHRLNRAFFALAKRLSNVCLQLCCVAYLIYFQYAAIFIAAVATRSIDTYWKPPKLLQSHLEIGCVCVLWKPVFSIVFMVKRLNEVLFSRFNSVLLCFVSNLKISVHLSTSVREFVEWPFNADCYMYI